MKEALIALGVLAVLAAGALYFIFNGFIFSGTQSSTDSYATSTPQGTDAQQPITQPEQPAKKVMQATLHTNQGDITIELNPAAPNIAANFIKLAQSGFYDGTKFHRVIKGFMDQGGDPLSKDDSQAARWGTGGPGYQLPDENLSAPNSVGVVAMANSGPNTNGSQFFINAADNHFLDGKYSVFGRVTAGLDVVMAINATPTGANDVPLQPIVINSITLK